MIGRSCRRCAHSYVLLNSIGSPTLEDGKYLYNPATGKIEVQWMQGIGSEKAAAPQGRLMATVINGILSRKLPWSLVLLGVALVIGIELLGVRSLTFAVGAYLSIGTTLAIFCGGVVRWLVDQAAARAGAGAKTEAESEVSSGSLYASGLIAAGGIMGLVGVCAEAAGKCDALTTPHFSATNPLYKDWVSVLAFASAGVQPVLLCAEADAFGGGAGESRRRRGVDCRSVERRKAPVSAGALLLGVVRLGLLTEGVVLDSYGEGGDYGDGCAYDLGHVGSRRSPDITRGVDGKAADGAEGGLLEAAVCGAALTRRCAGGAGCAVGAAVRNGVEVVVHFAQGKDGRDGRRASDGSSCSAYPMPTQILPAPSTAVERGAMMPPANLALRVPVTVPAVADGVSLSKELAGVPEQQVPPM